MRLIVSDDVRGFPTCGAVVMEASGVRNGASDDDSLGLPGSRLLGYAQ
jgi:hypothetical protein